MIPIQSETNMICVSELSGSQTLSLGGEFNLPASAGKVALLKSRLYGRDKESNILKQAFHRVCLINEGPNTSEVVVVHGQSGCGKTALVDQLRKYSTSRGAYYVAGKFDQLANNQPYSAIVECLTDLVDLIQQGEHVEKFVLGLKESLGGDVSVISELISNLSYLDVSFRRRDEQAAACVGQAFARLKIQCRRFLRAVSSLTQPLVMFIDDLQWKVTDR
jgi:predicted ATPase